MITKHIEILSRALKHKKIFTPSHYKRIILARKRIVYLLEFRFGFKPVGWVGDESNPVLIYNIKGTQIGYPSHCIGGAPWMGAKQPKEYTKPSSEEVTKSLNYIERFLTKYGNSIHKMDTNQFKQFRQIIEGGLL